MSAEGAASVRISDKTNSACSLSEQALVKGGGQRVLVSLLQQQRQVSSRTDVEPLRDPRRLMGSRHVW